MIDGLDVKTYKDKDKGCVVFEHRKSMRAFRVFNQNPGFLVVSYEAYNMLDHTLNYRKKFEKELPDMINVGTYIEDMIASFNWDIISGV